MDKSMIEEKAKKIRCFLSDVDGTLSNGYFYFGDPNTEYKAFHVHDGMGMVLLGMVGIDTGIITISTSDLVRRRSEQLNMKHAYLGQIDKIEAYEQIKAENDFTDEHIAYIGDDLPDLPIIERAGLSFAVGNAHNALKEKADVICTNPGGSGAVREACDLILDAQNLHDEALQRYINKGYVS